SGCCLPACTSAVPPDTPDPKAHMHHPLSIPPIMQPPSPVRALHISLPVHPALLPTPANNALTGSPDDSTLHNSNCCLHKLPLSPPHPSPPAPRTAHVHTPPWHTLPSYHSTHTKSCSAPLPAIPPACPPLLHTLLPTQLPTMPAPCACTHRS